MTNEEVKGRLESFIDTFNICKEHDNALVAVSISKEDIQAFTMAIKALEQQLCEDAVSRQAVIKLLSYDWANRPAHKAVESVRNLPPVTPKEKAAEWYEEDGCEGACEGYMSAGVICSQCGEMFCGYIGNYDFCPNCGARMVSK